MMTETLPRALLFAIIFTAVSHGQSAAISHADSVIDLLIVQGKNLTEEGYITWDKDKMLRGYAILNRACITSPGNKFAVYYTAYAAYRLIIYGMVTKQDGIYDQFAHIADESTKRLTEKYTSWSEPYSLLAAIYGIEIAHNWLKGPILGPKSDQLLKEAISSDSTNPRAYLILGISKLNAPSLFGGSVDQAIEYFTKSIALYEREKSDKDRPNSLNPDWGYEDALAWLGLAYEKKGRLADALKVYEKALQSRPNYARVKYSLLPELRKKMASAVRK
ncbi:MAG: tetratricopeptide repeat protein [Candidatus Kryptoniota bacterium]